MFVHDDPQMIRLESIPVPTNAQVHVMSKGFKKKQKKNMKRSLTGF